MNNNDFYSNNNFDQNPNEPHNQFYDQAAADLKQRADSLSSKCMVLGILAIAFTFFCPCIPSFIFAIISLVLCSKVKKLTNSSKLNGYQLTGMICSIIALCVSLIYVAIMVFYAAIVGIVFIDEIVAMLLT